MRALISATVINQQSPDSRDANDSIANGLAFINRWQGKNSRITPIFGPHSNYTLNADQLVATREAANSVNVPISIHMSESQFELSTSKASYGKTSIELFESIGFLEGPTIGAHVVWHPVDGLVELDHPILELLNSHVPRRDRLVDERGAGTPAERIGVGDAGRADQFARLIQ